MAQPHCRRRGLDWRGFILQLHVLISYAAQNPRPAPLVDLCSGRSRAGPTWRVCVWLCSKLFPAARKSFPPAIHFISSCKSFPPARKSYRESDRPQVHVAIAGLPPDPCFPTSQPLSASSRRPINLSPSATPLGRQRDDGHVRTDMGLMQCLCNSAVCTMSHYDDGLRMEWLFIAAIYTP